MLLLPQWSSWAGEAKVGTFLMVVELYHLYYSNSLVNTTIICVFFLFRLKSSHLVNLLIYLGANNVFCVLMLGYKNFILFIVYENMH